ncbi:MAG: serine/threonine-protein phosphatase [Phycisphaeraceae bacterium]|nr:serine/threonine-protein phosphatase [Phycisphaeraceae bacterium]
MHIATDPHTPESAAAPHTIACMEIWGGQERFHGGVSVTGNDVFVSSDPFTGDSHGGDIYYLSNCAGGLVTRIALADVSGHGSEVADLARTLRDLMRRHINTPDQSRFATALNHAFSDAASAGRFATAILLTYFAPSDHMIVCNAGHPRPLLFRARSHRWSLLDPSTPGAVAADHAGDTGIANLPLGIIHPTSYIQFAIPLDKGDLIVLYSDALIEAAGPDGQQLGEPGLLALASALNPDAPDRFRDDLFAAIAQRTGRASFDDDATLILLHHNASNPPRQSLADRAGMLARWLGLTPMDVRPAGASELH